MAKKYEITEKTFVNPQGTTLHRIRAIKTFDTILKTVKEGDLGGWIEEESNLSQEGNCWIFDNGSVYGKSMLLENALVGDRVKVSNKSIIRGTALIVEHALVDNSIIESDSLINNKASVCNSYIRSAFITDKAMVIGAIVDGKTRLDLGYSEGITILGNACISKHGIISWNDDYLYLNGLTFYQSSDPSHISVSNKSGQCYDISQYPNEITPLDENTTVLFKKARQHFQNRGLFAIIQSDDDME